LDYRSSLLTDGLREFVEPDFVSKSEDTLQTLVEKYSHRQRIAGIGVVNENGDVLASSSSLPKGLPESKKIASFAMDAGKDHGDFTDQGRLYAFASPLHDGAKTVGALVVVQQASYINDELAAIWLRNFSTVLVQLVLSLLLLWLVLRWFVYAPIRRIRAIVNVARMANDEHVDIPKNTFLDPLVNELAQIQKDLAEVRRQVNEQAVAIDKDQPKRRTH
jgi:hypothetical protein